jgi:L-amino acid N-acyltransferase YncA
MMNWIIRAAEEKDIEAITDIYNQAVVAGFQTADITPVSVSSRLDWLRVHVEANLPVLVALSDDKVIGWISLSSYRPGREALRFTVEVSYYVDKDFQRQGVASLLLQEILKVAHEQNFYVVFAIVLEVNVPSVQLLEKAGFQKWGFLPQVAVFEKGTCGHLYYGMQLKAE